MNTELERWDFTKEHLPHNAEASRRTEKPGNVEEVPQHADLSTKAGDSREARTEIEGEDGVITLTSAVTADDTANMGGDNTNIQSRAETAQEFITCAGCHTSAGKVISGSTD